MTYYGLASRLVDEVLELYPTREEAEHVLRTVVAKAPALAVDAFVTEFELEEPSPN